jgi:hypothetical protein
MQPEEIMMRRILAGPAILIFLVSAQAQENVPLKPGTGMETVEANCGACHSLDYPRINAPFLKHQGWEAVVNKMVNAFGAPIKPAEAKVIIDYLAENYGSVDHGADCARPGLGARRCQRAEVSEKGSRRPPYSSQVAMRFKGSSK